MSEISRVYTVIEHHTHNQFVSEGIFFLFTQAISLTDGKYAVPTKVIFSFGYIWMEAFTCKAKGVVLEVGAAWDSETLI